MSGGNSAYSPLPQSNSDSDGSSEEELHITQENRIVNRTAKTQISKTEKTYIAQKKNVINCKPLSTDGDIGVMLTFQSGANEVSILKPNNSLKIFSTCRKVCFIFSLLLCIFTVIVFIWILPCNVETCLSTSNIEIIKSWKKTLQDLELYGPISIVPNSDQNQNLVFLMRSSSGTDKEEFESGIISLNGANGSVCWQKKLNKQPADIDCKLIDINLDGYTDCLVYGSKFLKAIHSGSGSELWDIQNANKREINLLDFPLQLPDMNDDKVNDLLTSCSFKESGGKTDVLGSNFQNYLVILSGKTGEIINNPVRVKLCSAIHNLLIENNSVVSYTCYSSTQKESMQTINLSDIYKPGKNITKNLNDLKKLHQHQEEPNTFHVNGHKLILENHGHCPQDCSFVVDVKDEKEGPNNSTIFSFKETNAYGMTPVLIKSKERNGFVLKFWKWYSKKEKLNLQNNIALSSPKLNVSKKSTKEKLSKKKLKLLETFTDEMFLESETDFQRYKRTVNTPNKELDKDVSHLNLRLISENIVSVTFNNTNTFIKNITESKVIQVCRKTQICQPNVYEQKHSIIAADLNKDGREELISYTSRYIHRKGMTLSNESWQLQSMVQVINL